MMRIKELLIIVVLCFTAMSFGQEWDFDKPDYKSIEKNIKKKKSNLFYETLMNRYLEGDSTMTTDEKRHLYYGYSFQETYSPYSRSDYVDSLRIVFDKEKRDIDDHQKIVRFTDAMLVENPFNIRAINNQLYALEELAIKDKFDIRLTQLKTIYDALISSGNGTTKEDAFYVIYTSHEYDLLNILGFEYGGSQTLIEHYDYLTLAKNDAGLNGLYFDVTRCLASLSNLLKD